MKIDVLLADSNTIELKLNKREENGKYIWSGFASENKSPEYEIAIALDNDNNITSIVKGSEIYSSREDIKDHFLSRLIEDNEKLLELELSGLESTDDENNLIEEEGELKPYDPELIRVDTKNISISYVFEMMVSETGDLDLSPDFQRNFVWTDITRKSRLIESILLRIPLPVFYLSQDDNGILQVIDGVQRLTVIKSFLHNEFKLKNLEYLEDCEGCYFNKKGSKSLDAKYVRRINQTQLIFNIIDPQTPHKVKFEIFKRINTGGKPLNYQEVRNCLANEKTRSLLRCLSTSDEFKTATDTGVSSIRMADQELIMRFIGFYYIHILKTEKLKYKGDMNQFLDETLELLNGEKENILGKIQFDFLRSMKTCHYLFGKYAFRKCNTEHLEPYARKQLINKSLFTAFSVLLSTYDYTQITKRNEPMSLISYLADKIDEFDLFFTSISYGTSDRRRIDHTFQVVKSLIDVHVES
jgi:hypothetical protein